VRLVDREQRNARLFQEREEAFVVEPLGRDVEQLQCAAAQALTGRARLLLVQRRVEPRGLDSARS
jgi:hypothetical protein